MKTTMVEPTDPKDCGCWACLNARSVKVWWMVVCDICGNKRCPHANNHVHKCTNSNDTNQLGSKYA